MKENKKQKSPAPYEIGVHTESSSDSDHPGVSITSQVGGYPEGDVKVCLKLDFPTQVHPIASSYTGLVAEHVLRPLLCATLDTLVRVLAKAVEDIAEDTKAYDKAKKALDFSGAVEVLSRIHKKFDGVGDTNPLTGEAFKNNVMKSELGDAIAELGEDPEQPDPNTFGRN